jgi:hypothetical protein
LFEQLKQELLSKIGLLCRFLDVESLEEFRPVENGEGSALEAMQFEQKRRSRLVNELETKYEELLKLFVHVDEKYRNEAMNSNILAKVELLKQQFLHLEAAIK